MKREEGVTRISLENGKLLSARYGAVTGVILVYDADDWYQTHVTYRDGHTHVFTGFSWGYSGEGPSGLAKWAEENDVPLTREQIVGLKGDKLVAWKWGV